MHKWWCIHTIDYYRTIRKHKLPIYLTDVVHLLDMMLTKRSQICEFQEFLVMEVRGVVTSRGCRLLRRVGGSLLG